VMDENTHGAAHDIAAVMAQDERARAAAKQIVAGLGRH